MDCVHVEVLDWILNQLFKTEDPGLTEDGTSPKQAGASRPEACLELWAFGETAVSLT